MLFKDNNVFNFAHIYLEPLTVKKIMQSEEVLRENTGWKGQCDKRKIIPLYIVHAFLFHLIFSLMDCFYPLTWKS